MHRLLALLVAALLLVPGCGGGGEEAKTSPSDPSPQNYGVRGPHAVGVTRLQLDEQRPVEVFYPADHAQVAPDAAPYRYTPEEVWGPMLDALPPGTAGTVAVAQSWFDIPADQGPFPLVVFSHGVGVMRFSYAFHAAHLASWGYVVALPQIPTRDLAARLGGTNTPTSQEQTLLDTVTLLETESRRPGSVLEDRVTGDQIAIAGHAAGGRDAALAANDPAVDVWLASAPAAPVPDDATGGHNIIKDGEGGYDAGAGEFDLTAFLTSATPPAKPSMIVAADNDAILPLADRRAIYDWLPAPKRLVVLADTGYAVFVNECLRIQQRGGSALAEALGWEPTSVLRVGLENGCLSTFAPVEDVWATLNHVTVAQLNLALGIKAGTAAASLERSYLDVTFPGRIAEYDVQE